MTNASVNNVFKIIPVLVVSIALSVSAFAGTAHAQFANEGYVSGGVPDFGSYSPDTFGSYSPDTYGSYSPDTYGAYSPDTTGYYSPDTYGMYSPDTNGYYSPDTYGTYSPDTYNSYTPYTSSPSYSNYGTAGYSSSAPFYSSQPSFSSASPFFSSQPSFSSAAAPSITTQRQSQSQSSYNSNPNTNVNYTPSYSTSNASAISNPTVTSTNTNTNNPVANASTGPISNTNTNNASTGPINVVNTVNVIPAGPQRNAQYTIPAPSCTIYASNYQTYGYSYANYNQPVTLTWSSQGATSAYITPQVGSVNPSGSQTVYPSGYTTYTLTVSGPGGSASCQATANYAYNNYVAPVAPVYPTPVPVYQPASPAVSLTQIPYTGFDFGPVGNAVYWMSLLAFAAAAGYLMVYWRGGALAFASSLLGSRNSQSDSYDLDEVAEEIETPAGREYAESVAAPVAVEQAAPVSANALPTMHASRITSDSMILDTSAGAPRIVIARA